jgi:hypothetical protein
MESKIDARLHSAAASGRGSVETAAAMNHRQPTPRSIADAEAQIGDLPGQVVRIVEQAMLRARTYNLSGKASACARALREARSAIDN